MNDSPVPNEVLSGMISLQKRIAFEDEICSTPVGRRSLELRKRAHALAKNDKQESAFTLCEEAANLFSEHDPSAAAAMAWFDLARCYEYKIDGVMEDNLRNAETLFRRALASPALAADPHRMGTTRDALASCLRNLAHEAEDATRKALLAEATNLFEEAVTLALSTGTAGFEDVVRFSHNLGNCLAQQERFDAALIAMDRAEAYARRLKGFVEPGEQGEYLSMILVHSAGYRASRGREGDSAQAKRQLREAIDIKHPEWVDMAQMRLAQVMLNDPTAPKEEAQTLLRRVRAERIRPAAMLELGALYTDAGLRKEALKLYHQELQAAIERWRHAMADHVADHRAAEAQRFAHLAARLHLEEESALEAFFTLEDVSGLRFVEALEAPSRVFRNPIARVIGGHHHAKSLLAVLLESTASRLAHKHVHLSDLVEEMREQAAHTAKDEEWKSGADEVVGIFEQALKETDPVGFLRRKSLELAEDVKRLTRRMHEFEPGSDRTDNKPWLYRLTKNVLRDLLQEYPGHAFVRLSLDEDLLVITVWLEGDEVVARHHRVKVPADLHSLIFKHRWGVGVKDASLEDLARLSTSLEALDLSPALPPQYMAHAVLLPSFAASFLPLSALGPPGKTLLDRFDALSWTPCLAPLFVRQAPLSPREGVVSVAPGGTRHHAFAFGVPLPGERRIEGPDATEERVLEAGRQADVVCLYTHGKHASERGPYVDLYGSEYLSEQSLSREWAGMERVELWACQSGVNAPTDPLTPQVDEAFGLDVAFVREGVRSAIGTLWSVPDFVTACLVRHYRDSLRQGLTAPRALANAQRFWRDEGARSLLDHLTQASNIKEGLRSFQATLGGGGDGSIDDKELEALLGPVASVGDNSRRDIEDQVRRLAHPLAWAGFRFVGVAERRPTEPYDPDLFRPLTPEEIAEGKRIVDETLHNDLPVGKSLDDWIEGWLGEATKLTPGAHPTPEQAIRVARLYRDRIISSHRHNLLAALAWLHEAMAVLKWTHKGAQRREARQKLQIEAAWLWIEMARGEAVLPFDVVLPGPDPVALSRARRLLEGMPNDSHVGVARTWIDLLEAISKGEDGLDAAVQKAWKTVAPVAREMLAESYEAIRTRTAAWEIVHLAPAKLPDAVELCARQVDEVLRRGSIPFELFASNARLRSAMALLAAESTPEILRDMEGIGDLTPRELAREALVFGRASNTALSYEMPFNMKRFNRACDALEGALWGWPDDNRSPIWASTGTLGSAYRRLAGSLFAGLASAPEDARDAIQIIACLQPLCDLRLPLLRRIACLLRPWENRPFLWLWSLARDRELILEYLEDAALMRDVTQLTKATRRFEITPHRLDPFSLSAIEIQKKVSGVPDWIPWQVGYACSWVPEVAESSRTAAFHAVRNVAVQTEELGRLWQLMVRREAEIENADRARSFARIFDPGIRLPSRQDLLRHLAPGVLVLGLCIEPSGHLVAASVWNSRDGIQQRAHTSEGRAGFHAQNLLAKLHVGLIPGQTSLEHATRTRAEAWRELCEILGPSLDAVLGPALEEAPLRIAVLDPGALRPLPLLGMPVLGAPLFERASSVVHVPTMYSEPPILVEGELDACWPVRDRDAGETSLGEAAIGTLCRWFEPELIEPPAYRTRDLPEVTTLEELGPRLASLCIYAVTSPIVTYPSLSSFNLEGARGFTNKNARGLLLPSCEVVELWTASAGAGPVEAIRRDDRDRIPGLARDFLACGAAAVLDLAWPVFDLVKALVCERFGVIRRVQPMNGAMALQTAVVGAAELLARWRDAALGMGSLQEALAWLDEERRVFARSLGLDARAVVPFAAQHEVPYLKGLSIEALVEEACSPVHLAAFRYWTWL